MTFTYLIYLHIIVCIYSIVINYVTFPTQRRIIFITIIVCICSIVINSVTFLTQKRSFSLLLSINIYTIDDVKKTLDFMFTDDDCYESLESYVSAVDQTKSKLLVNRVKLLRGWKQYLHHDDDNNNDHEITENFLQGMQTVLRIDPKTVLNNITTILENNKNRLNDLYDSLIIELVPNFLESDEFANYYEAHAEVKARNKKLRIDSKVMMIMLVM